MCVMQNLQLRLLNAAAVKRSLTAGCEVGLDWSLPRLQLSTDFLHGKLGNGNKPSRPETL